MKKILSLTLVLAMIFSSFSFNLPNIANAAENADGILGVERMIYTNDFSINNPDDLHYEFTPNGGSIEIADGKLNISRSENAGNTLAYIYPDEKHEPVSGLLGISFSLKKESAGKVIAKIQQPFSKDYIMIMWSADDEVMVKGCESLGGTERNYKPGNYPSSSELRVDALLSTVDGWYTLWLGGEKVLQHKYARVAPGESISHLLFYLEDEDFLTVSVDDIKIFDAVLTDDVVAKRDYDYLTSALLTAEAANGENIIGSDLTLPSSGINGSTITWKSSDTRYIANDGKVTKPVDAEILPEVTLTATIASGEYTMKKSFKFRVQSSYSSVINQAQMELDKLSSEKMLSQSDTDTSNVRCSLKLPDTTPDGTPITWTSSNENVITKSGRVIRPKNNEATAVVNMTAAISIGGDMFERTFEFTVIPDDAWADPNHMTDEEYFGKWNGEGWEITGKLDYTVSALFDVEAKVKNNDYSGAKSTLLEYMRLKTQPAHLPLDTRDTEYCDNMALTDVHTLQTTDYYQGHTEITSAEYAPYYIPVKTAQIVKGGKTAYAVTAKYNENSKAVIASLHHSNSAYHPAIELTVNGEKVTYYAAESAGVRAGKYSYANYCGMEELPVKMFGEHLSDETYKALFEFDFSNLDSDDVVTDAKLILHAKSEQSYVDSKELLILREPQGFDEESVKWNTNLGYVYNFNGLTDGTIWKEFSNSDHEYDKQMSRFPQFGMLASEYEHSGDEKYAYYMIDTIMDFIADRGGPVSNSSYPTDRENMAGWPRSLDAASRMHEWTKVLMSIAKSNYMTPEAMTAIMKTLWSTIDTVTYSTVKSGNWVQIEKNNIIDVAIAMPEYSASGELLNKAVQTYESLMTDINFLPDGSYIEKTGGYSQNAFSKFVDFRSKMDSLGYTLSQEYYDMLHKAAYYNIQLYYPNGETLMWGDEENGKRSSGAWNKISTWFDDKEFEYISTFGASGKKPGWTSMHYPDSTTTFMRSGWDKEALFMFAQTRGYGQHGHQDDNGVLAMAYGRPLLVDSGLFSYTETDPERVWGVSTEAHNTVTVNDKTQTVKSSKGIVHDWNTHSSYDFLSQTSYGYDDCPHKRSIMFVKPDLWIVSDRLTPADASSANTYKQFWHMLPDANLSTNSDNLNISSNFADGANIMIASADTDASVVTKTGKYSTGYQQNTDSEYAYFEKTVTGNATFDSVLVPTENGKASVDVQRLDTGYATDEITAITFETEANDEKNTYYYMLNYSLESGSEKTFGNFSTDAEMALISENSIGEIDRIVIKGGTYLKRDGNTIATLREGIGDISVTKNDTQLNIESSSKNISSTELMFEGVTSVSYNSKPIAFIQKLNGMMFLTDKEATDVSSPVEVSDIILFEDFSGTDYDEKIKPYILNGTGALAVSGSGELVVSSETSTTTGAEIYMNAENTGITSGEYVAQFKLTRPDTLPVVQVHGSSIQGQPIFSYVWGNSTAGGNLKYSTVKGATQNTNKTYKSNDTATSIVVTMKIDIDDMKFWLWFDSTLAVDGMYPRNKGAANLGKLQLYTEGAGLTFGVDDIVLCSPVTDKQKVKSDLDALTFDSIFDTSVLFDNILKKDVKLPTTGAYGSTITWTSSNEKYINAKGNVTFADTLESANPEVTLTANAALGEVSMTKDFRVKVAKENEVFSHIPKYKEIHYQNDFSVNNITDANYVLTQNGGTVTIVDNELNLTRTENVGQTITDIYLNENKSSLTGNVYASFVMRKEETGRVICNIQSSGNKDYLRIIWGSDGRVSVTCKTSTSATSDKNYHFEGYTDTELRVDILLKTQSKKFDLWLNGSKLLSDRTARVTNVACSLTNFRFYLEGTDFGTATVDDIKVYYAREALEGLSISEDGKTATYTFYGEVPEDCMNCAVVIAVYNSPRELVDVKIGTLSGNTATVSIDTFSSGHTVKYMAFKDMENIVPLVKAVEKAVE